MNRFNFPILIALILFNFLPQNGIAQDSIVILAPPPPPPESKVEEVFINVVEDMPRFPGCEDIGDKEERNRCATKKLLNFIHKNVEYPPLAEANDVEGIVVVAFVVEKNGKVTDARVVRDIGFGCGEEAVRVVNLMNQQGITWIPTSSRRRPVRVQFNLPVRFKLPKK